MRALLLVSPCLLAGATGLAWVWQTGSPVAAQGLMLALWLLAGVWIWYEWHHPAVGLLHWDGQQWSWESAGARRLGSVQPRLDWQQGLLLEFRAPDGQRCWLWPERQGAPAHWPALRRALFAPTPAEADRADPRTEAEREG